MKWFIALTMVLAVNFALAFAGTQVAVAQTEAPLAQSMYATQELVGTLLTCSVMYEAEGATCYSGDLRVDLAAGDRKPGAKLTLRYPTPSLQPQAAPGVGDQIRVKIRPNPEGNPPFLADDFPLLLGRGELVRPGEGATLDLGAADAKVLVKMFAPLQTSCHAKTAQLLKELATQDPARVRVQFFEMSAVAARQEMRKEKLGCATVLVNNRLNFTLATLEGKRPVAFEHRPNEASSTYHSEDVITVIEQELKRLYPAK